VNDRIDSMDELGLGSDVGLIGKSDGVEIRYASLRTGMGTIAPKRIVNYPSSVWFTTYVLFCSHFNSLHPNFLVSSLVPLSLLTSRRFA
jgi:hypothetical protein